MCGIVAAVSTKNIVPILIQGLARLEYRGYDSCGVAVHDEGLKRSRSTQRVDQLKEQIINTDHLQGVTGIAHTRWATHGAPEVFNAHPHFSHGTGIDALEQPGRIALVHNGIIENHDELRQMLQNKGYIFHSQTDTEVIVHLLDFFYQGDLLQALLNTVKQLKGAYALAAFCHDEPHRIVAARHGAPLLMGIGDDGQSYFAASDSLALAGITNKIVYLEEGDCVDLQLGNYKIVTQSGQTLIEEQRPIQTVPDHALAADLGSYRHYMQKEIFEQPIALSDTLEGIETITPTLFNNPLKPTADGSSEVLRCFQSIDRVLILACGTSYYSGCVAKFWVEEIAKIPCDVEIASEYRYRTSVPHAQTLVICISQSGETADTLAALKHAQTLGMMHTLTICNVASSAMVRQCKFAYITRAGAEIGVASTKAFTTQLAGLFLLTLTLAKTKERLPSEKETQYIQSMRHLPVALRSVLALEPLIIGWSQAFAQVNNVLFLGRGLHYPIALEGALKLKEISYIHAEAYPAGELKHGPLALITSSMPVITVAPNDALLEKLKSNMQEVQARGGVLYVLADKDTHIHNSESVHVIHMPENYGALSPLLHVVPLQLLAYHTALARGTDVDKPRNLAKSVTVE